MRAALAAALAVPTLLALPPAAGAQTVTDTQLMLSVAIEGAQGAIAACEGQGYRIAVTVVDKAGAVRVTLRSNGANIHLLEGAERKAYTSAMIRVPTTEMAAIIARNPGANALMNFDRMTPLGGGLPIRLGDEVIGGLGVAGVPVGGAGGAGDEGCARAGLEAITARLGR
jgi:uncharacterized protein GlcG (DUF336 family)